MLECLFCTHKRRNFYFRQVSSMALYIEGMRTAAIPPLLSRSREFEDFGLFLITRELAILPLIEAGGGGGEWKRGLLRYL